MNNTNMAAMIVSREDNISVPSCRIMKLCVVQDHGGTSVMETRQRSLTNKCR